MDFLTALDNQILWLIQDLFKSNGMDILMVFVTRLGDFGTLWIGLALLLLLRPATRHIGVSMGLAMLLAFVLGNLGLKPFFSRPRPFDVDLNIALLIPVPSGFSFPSGHTMNAFSAMTALGLFKRSWGTLALLAAVAISFSRLYLMVHYPSDVLAGVLVGILGGYLAHWLVVRFYPAPSVSMIKE